ncbi:MAG: hypothetical protein JWN56_2253 [Sphingobacteriales bacterium]|nr:hypothetical protein [Sphingobacteriales bacterium]
MKPLPLFLSIIDNYPQTLEALKSNNLARDNDLILLRYVKGC